MTKLIEYFNSLNEYDKKQNAERKRILKEYKEWVIYEPSIIDGSPNVSRPHHVRTRNNAGTGMKPNDLYQVPITNTQHVLHHTQGMYQKLFLEELPELHMRFLRETNQYKILNEIECGRL